MQHVLQGDRGDDGAVARTGNRHLALPDEAAGLVDDLVDIVGAEAHRQLVGVDARDEVALIDPHQPELDPVEIDRRHRQPGAALARQHIAGAGEADRRLAIGDDDPALEGVRHGFARRGGEAGEQFDLIGLAVFQAVEAQRVATRGDDAVEGRFAAHKGAVRKVALGRDLLVEAQTGARGIRLGLDLDLGDAEGDEPLQLVDPLGDGGGARQGNAGLKGGERLLLLVVAIVIAADQKERVAALDRIGRFGIGVVGRDRRAVIVGRDEVLRQPQPDKPVIGAIGDRLRQIVDRLGVAFRAVFGIGVAAQPRDQRRLPLVDRDAVDQFLAIGGARLGQLLRLIFLSGGRSGEQNQEKKCYRAQHRSPPRSGSSHAPASP
jgi:hypothetical protein